MKDAWNNVIINKISLAVHVEPGTGKPIHKERPFHGFVLSDKSFTNDYIFSDGNVMRVEGDSLFYLPKGSSYCAKKIIGGGCYAINFDADISDDPFTIKLKNPEHLQKLFKSACDHWERQSEMSHTCAMRALYDSIYTVQKENIYLSGRTLDKIAPAIEALDAGFTDNSLSVTRLAELCSMSEVYFRRIFSNRFGMSPKEYMIKKRMEYAVQLLASGQFSVGEVSSMCGYFEPCHFSREFKKRFGVSPREYNKGNIK